MTQAWMPLLLVLLEREDTAHSEHRPISGPSGLSGDYGSSQKSGMGMPNILKAELPGGRAAGWGTATYTSEYLTPGPGFVELSEN